MATSAVLCGFRVVALAASLASAGAAASAATIRGQIHDVTSHPIPGAAVVVTSLDWNKRYATAITDGEGRFAVALSDATQASLWVRATADGFELGGAQYFPQKPQDLDVTLERRIDAAFLDRLIVASDPGVRRELVVQFLHGDRHIETVFPYLGRLRSDLRKATTAPRNDPREPDTRGAARALLQAWGDPADDQVTKAFWPESYKVEEPQGVTGATLEVVCSSWAEVHFRQQQAEKPWPEYRCSTPTLDPTGTHAMMRFEVGGYYQQLLFLMRDGSHWRLRTVYPL